MKKKTIVFRGLAAVMAFVLMASASAITLTFQYAALINRALGAYAVGSTFKLLIAAAALEQGSLPNRPIPATDGWM